MNEPAPNAQPVLVHPTYRHLDRAIRLAGLTLAQWAGLLGAVFATWVLWKLLPLPSTTGLSVAITITGVPVAVAAAAADQTIDVTDRIAAARHRLTRPRIYPPGATPPHDAR